MKKILITGTNSYVGMSLEKWLQKEPEKYIVETVSTKDDSWKEKDFSEFDVLVHVAGIAHIKETKENRDIYFKVNRDLAYQTALKAKKQGIKQFIFLSSMSIYGIENGIIDRKSPTNPKSNYGKSKLQAEELIMKLSNDVFRVAILRPPMIYGKGCKGNYPRLAKLAVKVPVFPDVDNKRSMIYIDNLCEYIRLLIEVCGHGLFFPQNHEYVKTSEMVKLIAEAHRKKIYMIKLLNPLIKILKINILNKVFGDLVYAKEMSNDYVTFYDNQRLEYKQITFEESIRLTES